jgi:predicted dehydrogenase
MELTPFQRAQLVGSAGHIELSNPWNPPGDQPSELVLDASAELEHPRREHIGFDPVDQYTVLVELFARAARGGGEGPIPLEDSIRNMVVLDALRRSADSGRVETVDRD